MPTPTISLLAIDSTGHRLVVDKLDTQSKTNPFRRLKVIDLQDSETQLELFAERWTPSGTDYGDSFKTKSAAFSRDGSHIAIRRTEPECRSTRTVMPMVLMPVSIPSCSGLRISYMIWDLQTGRESAELEDVADSGFSRSLPNDALVGESGSLPTTAPSPWTARIALERTGNRNGNTRDLKTQTDAETVNSIFAASMAGQNNRQPDEVNVVVLLMKFMKWISDVKALSVIPKGSVKPEEAARLYELLAPNKHAPALSQIEGITPGGSGFMMDGANAIVTTNTQHDTESGSSLLVTRRLSFSAGSVIEEACARLEPEHQVFSPAQWLLQFPGVSFHQICASNGVHQ
jgi:hypothetical protein